MTTGLNPTTWCKSFLSGNTISYFVGRPSSADNISFIDPPLWAPLLILRYTRSFLLLSPLLRSLSRAKTSYKQNSRFFFFFFRKRSVDALKQAVSLGASLACFNISCFKFRFSHTSWIFTVTESSSNTL
jgi:hypothetical protein